jgi:hypothetical protein
MVATLLEAAPVTAIQPDVLYSLKEFCRFYPTASGRRLSVATARRWVTQNRIPAHNIAPPGAKRITWAIRGADILVLLVPKTASRIVTPAQERARTRAMFQAWADTTGRVTEDKQNNEWYYPVTYLGERPPRPKDIRRHWPKTQVESVA